MSIIWPEKHIDYDHNGTSFVESLTNAEKAFNDAIDLCIQALKDHYDSHELSVRIYEITKSASTTLDIVNLLKSNI